MQDCIFCKIALGEMPSKKVYEDTDVVVILDINPANKGHMLVIPKKHVEDISGIDEKLFDKVANVTKKMAELVKERLKPDGINILQNNGKHAGQLVPHMHFHVIPRYPDDKVMIAFPRTQGDLDSVLRQLKAESEDEDDSLF